MKPPPIVFQIASRLAAKADEHYRRGNPAAAKALYDVASELRRTEMEDIENFCVERLTPGQVIELVKKQTPIMN